jgi:Pyruvate/2-oxoacid:ferredoxin oxidoreductase delta subunit
LSEVLASPAGCREGGQAMRLVVIAGKVSLMASTEYLVGGDAMPTVATLRIVLDTDTDVWCNWCVLPCASVIVYVVERDSGLPLDVHRLAYCAGCERQARLR